MAPRFSGFARRGWFFGAVLLIGLGGARALEFRSYSPSSAAVGQAIAIEGSGFTGATAVTFNGNASVFRVVSDEKIVARAPMAVVEGTIEIWKDGLVVSMPRAFVLDRPSSTVIGWGGQSFQFGKGQTVTPANVTNAVAISAGSTFSAAITGDGRLALWGEFTNVSSTLRGNRFEAVAASHGLLVAVDINGRLQSQYWPIGGFGYKPFPAEATNIVAVTPGLALRRDGKVFALVTSNYGGATPTEVNVPPATAIVGSFEGGLFLHRNGRVTFNQWSQKSVLLPLSNVVSIAFQGERPLLLTQTGELFAWHPVEKRMELFDENVVSVEGNYYDGVSVKADGTVKTYGYGHYGQTNAPAFLSNVAEVRCGFAHSLALACLPPKFALAPRDMVGLAGATVELEAKVVGDRPMELQWFRNGAWLPGATNETLTIENLGPLGEGEYQLMAWNGRGVVMSEAATVRMLDDFVAFGFSRPQLPGSRVTIFGRGLDHATAVTFNGISTPFWPLDENRIEALVPHGVVTGKLHVWVNGAYSEVPETYEAPDERLQFVPWGLATGPLPNTNVQSAVAIAVGDYHIVALKADGTVAAMSGVGYAASQMTHGQLRVPAAATNVIAISAGVYQSLALRADGTVVAWGSYQGAPGPPPADLRDVTAISAGVEHSLALLEDGTVRGWGDNSEYAAEPPLGLRDVVQVVASDCSIAIKADGSAVIWGGRYTAPKTIRLPSRIVQAKSRFVNLFLCEDGSTAIDYPGERTQNVPPLPTIPFKAVALAEFDSGLGIRMDGTLFNWRRPGEWTIALPPVTNVTALDAGAMVMAVLARQSPNVVPARLTELRVANLLVDGSRGTVTLGVTREDGGGVIDAAKIKIYSSTNVAGPWEFVEGVVAQSGDGFLVEGADGAKAARFFRVLESN